MDYPGKSHELDIINPKFRLPPMGVWLLFVAVVIFIVWSVEGILMPFIVSFVAAYMLNPVIEFFERWKIQRPLSSFVIVLSFFTLIVSGILIAIPFLKEEILKLAMVLPRYSQKMYIFLEPYVTEIRDLLNVSGLHAFDETFTNHLGKMATWSLQAAAGLFTNTLALANMIGLIVLTPIITFYLLRDWPLMVGSFKGLLPPKHSLKVVGLLERINQTLGGYLRGQALVCLTLFGYYACMLSLVGLNFSFTIASITGFFAFIPYFGYLIGVVAALGVALAQFEDWTPICLVVGVFLGGQILESYFLLPRMVGTRIGLHPVWIIFSLLAGGLLMGFSGLLFAMPVAATIGVLVRFVVDEYRNSIYYVL